MFLCALSITVFLFIPRCDALSSSRLHTGTLESIGPHRNHHVTSRSTHRSITALSWLPKESTGCRDVVATAPSTVPAFLHKIMPNAVHQPINSNRTTSVAPQNLDNPSYGRLTAEDASPPTTSSTQELIRSLGAELASLQTHNDRVSKLVYMGAKLFKGAPEPAVLRAPPPTLQESRSFSLPAPTANDEASRNFFLFQTPCSIEYKLVSGCVASIFLAVHVDKHGVVHVDGTSDSLITKAALALILDAVELQPTNKVLHLDPSDVAHQDTLATLSFMKRDGVATILDHIKSEVRAHSVLTGIQKHHPNRKKNSSNKRVAVLVSGGVDSSVALWKLKSRGYRVEAFYLKVWGVEKADETGNCEWATDVDHAMRVCSSLGVPLHILPFQDLYHERVLGPFIEGTRMGETPNPDVCCNEFIKFGAFLDYATRWGFSHVASGHYAAAVDDLSHADVSATGCSTQVNQGPHRITRLRLCKDLSKDQTYFLSRLTQSQLQRVIFPLSRLLKTEVRYIARTLGFANHDRKDSVGLCFLGKVNVRSFLADRLGRHPGPIVDCETQERIGEHPGLYHFTVGQREGIARYLSSVRDTHRARHVVKKDVATNTLYTSTDYHSAPYVGAGSVRRYFEICDIAWNVPDFLRYTQTAGESTPKLRLKLRHSPAFAYGDINFDDARRPTRASVHLHRADVGVATGQYAVFYVGDDCIGAGKMVAVPT